MTSTHTHRCRLLNMCKTALLIITWICGVSARHSYHPRDELSFGPLRLSTHDIKGTPSREEHNLNFWYDKSTSVVKERLKMKAREGIAKNLILFLGDGMSPTTVTAARIYMGQLSNRPGEEQVLSFENFPYTGLSKTYCVDSQVADSACSGTAYLSGVKTNRGAIGVTADVGYRDWKGMTNASYYTSSILEWAQHSGKGTGIVTTCKVTDASPVATYAHTASRYWQTDLDILKDAPNASGIKDITSQLVENIPGRNIKVIMGGGREVFLPKEQQDGYGYNGTRGDGKDLIQMWKSSKEAAKVKGTYITNRDQLLNVDVNNTDYLLGLFHHNHMDFHLQANATLQPTLAEMTTLAITMMQKEEKGYFLFIEGGRIDHGHHNLQAHLALDETVEFHKAIEVALRMTSEEDTLIVVTADHAHTMTLNGYPARGSDIITTLQNTRDNVSYSTLSYANGPNNYNFESNGSRHNIANDDRGNINYTFPATFYLNSETHGGEDVAVYARGPWAHLLVGVYEQTVIPHVMGFAARIGPGANITDTSTSGALGLTTHHVYLLLLLTVGLTVR